MDTGNQKATQIDVVLCGEFDFLLSSTFGKRDDQKDMIFFITFSMKWKVFFKLTNILKATNL